MPSTTMGLRYPDTFSATRQDVQNLMDDVDRVLAFLSASADEMCSLDGVYVTNLAAVSVASNTSYVNVFNDDALYDTDSFFGGAGTDHITLEHGVWLLAGSAKLSAATSLLSGSVQITSSTLNRVGGRQVGPDMWHANVSALALHYVDSGTSQEIRLVTYFKSSGGGNVTVEDARLIAARIALPWTDPT